MRTARIWNALKNPIRVGVAGAYAYEEIQWARDLDAINMKDFVNQSIAGVVSIAVITLSLETIVDCVMRLKMLRRAGLNDERARKEILYTLGVAIFSLGAAIYTGFNFFDQRHTGIVALLGLGVAALKAYVMRNDDFLTDRLRSKQSMLDRTSVRASAYSYPPKTREVQVATAGSDEEGEALPPFGSGQAVEQYQAAATYSLPLGQGQEPLAASSRLGLDPATGRPISLEEPGQRPLAASSRLQQPLPVNAADSRQPRTSLLTKGLRRSQVDS